MRLMGGRGGSYLMNDTAVPTVRALDEVVSFVSFVMLSSRCTGTAYYNKEKVAVIDDDD